MQSNGNACLPGQTDTGFEPAGTWGQALPVAGELEKLNQEVLTLKTLMVLSHNHVVCHQKNAVKHCAAHHHWAFCGLLEHSPGAVPQSPALG